MYIGLTGALEAVMTDDNGIPCTMRIAYISGWSIEDKTEMIETAKVGRTYKETLPSFQSWSASAEGAVVFEEGGHKELFRSKYAGEKLSVYFYLDDKSEMPGGNQSTYFYGTAYIESLGVDLSTEDKGNVSISLRGNGPLNLVAGGKDVRTDKATAKEYLGMSISEEGNLIVRVPGNLASGAYIDDANNLIIKL